MAKVIVEHHPEDCIGCAACTAAAPDLFEMEGDKAKLKDGKSKGSIMRKMTEHDQQAKEAADCCPVEAIKVKDN